MYITESQLTKMVNFHIEIDYSYRFTFSIIEAFFGYNGSYGMNESFLKFAFVQKVIWFFSSRLPNHFNRCLLPTANDLLFVQCPSENSIV